MNNMKFESDRYFTVSDYLASHGQLLVRSPRDDDNSKTIDVIFFGVRYLQLPTWLMGISISAIPDGQSRIRYDSVSGIVAGDNHVFEVLTCGESFYIVGSHFRVYENDLEFGETSLGLESPPGRQKEIALSNAQE
jgi:hypothetical protein